MDIVTSGDIAQQLDIDRDSVNYALRKSKVEPVGRAGLVRLFSASAIQRVQDYLGAKQRRSLRKEPTIGQMEGTCDG